MYAIDDEFRDGPAVAAAVNAWLTSDREDSHIGLRFQAGEDSLISTTMTVYENL